MKTPLWVFVIILTFLAGCASSAESGQPAWVDHLIKQFEDAAPGNPPLSIWRYDYHGQVVYFVPAHCCDIPGTLYDEDGEILCYPDGGVKGGGDGRCIDFFTERSAEQLIWQDPR